MEKSFFSVIQCILRRVSDVKQREINTTEPLLPEPSTFELERTIEKLKRQKSPSIDQIPTELIKAGGKNNLL